MVAPSRQMVICWLKCTCDKDCNDGGPLRADSDYVGSGSFSSFVPSPSVLSTDTLPFLNLFFPPGLAELPTSMIYKYNGDCRTTGLHKLWYPGIRDTSTWSKFGAHGERGDVFLFSNLGAL